MSSPLNPYRTLQVLPDAEQEVIQAAFRALALKYHPDKDRSARAAQRMREINQAYALLRDEAARAVYDRLQRRLGSAASAPQPIRPPTARNAPAEGSRVTFGRYSGWSLRDLARQDPDYLRWLSRHSSGIRFRTEIYQILGRQGMPAA